MASVLRTHEVTNQPPPLVGYDVFGADAALREAVERAGAGWALDELHDLGRRAGSESEQEWGRQAVANTPELRTHDLCGNRIDAVEYDPPYPQLINQAVRAGLKRKIASTGVRGELREDPGGP